MKRSKLCPYKNTCIDFTAGTTAEVDAQLSAGGGQAYIQMFEERTGGRNAGC